MGSRTSMDNFVLNSDLRSQHGAVRVERRPVLAGPLPPQEASATGHLTRGRPSSPFAPVWKQEEKVEQCLEQENHLNKEMIQNMHIVLGTCCPCLFF